MKLISLLVALLAVSGAYALQVTVEGANSNVDVAVDGMHVAHVVYERAGNIYYKGTGGEELIGAGAVPSIAVGPDRAPQVVFINEGQYWYATRTTGWSTPSKIGDANEGGFNWIDIDVDAQNSPHVVYVQSRHVYYTSGQPFTAPTDMVYEPRVFPNPNIKIDDEGYYHMAYNGRNWGDRCSWSWDYISVATNAPTGSGSFGRDPTGSGCPTSGVIHIGRNGLAVDGSGNSHLVFGAGAHYYGFVNGSQNNVATETVLTDATSPAIDAAGSHVAIAYQDGSDIMLLLDGGEPIPMGTGSSPAVGIGSTYVYYIGTDGQVFVDGDQPPADVPEFGTIAAGLVLVAGIGLVVMRRK